MMSAKNKWEVLEGIIKSGKISAEDMAILETYSGSRDRDIRYKTAEALALSETDRATKILLRLLEDKDELVRACACDSLCTSRSADTIAALKLHATGDVRMVRGYAILSIADIAAGTGADKAEFIGFFENSLNEEGDDWVKTAYYRALYMMGKHDALSDLVVMLNHDNDQIRCAAANMIADIASEDNIKAIIPVLLWRLKEERKENVAAVAAIKKALKDIGDRLG